jgi:hypothetical protein
MDSEYPECHSDAKNVDRQQIACRKQLLSFFEENREQVCFATQLAVQNEDRFFHWITYRAIDDLAGGPLKTEMRQMKTGAPIRLLWHRRHRYFRRDAARLVSLVEDYSDPNVCASLGLHADLAKRVARELGLPVDSPRALADGRMTRFERWHEKNL